jgi:glycosyltransferase involved in cell wall biosynthesis
MPRPLPAEPKVSILIICYNQENYIVEAITSAVEQDYANLEVVVSDDASTDRSPHIIREFAERYPGRVVPVLNPVNLGITRNSNAGLRACTGDLIAFVDSDDILLPGKINAQVEWFSKEPLRVLCGHQLEVFYEDGSPSHLFTRGLIEGRGAEPLVRTIPFGKSSMMVRADRIPPHQFDEALPVVSDLLMWVEVVRSDGLFGYVPGVLGRYRRHSSNVTNDPLNNLDQVERYLTIVRERFPQFRVSVDYALTRRLYYDVGVALLKMGRKKEARANFLKVLKREPAFTKGWIRFVQTFT